MRFIHFYIAMISMSLYIFIHFYLLTFIHLLNNMTNELQHIAPFVHTSHNRMYHA
jgi:hypothetical protein